MFETDIVSVINMIIHTNRVNITHLDDCTYCFYQFGQEQVGVILSNGIVHRYKTNMIPNSVITNALIDYCEKCVTSID